MTVKHENRPLKYIANLMNSLKARLLLCFLKVVAKLESDRMIAHLWIKTINILLL